MKRVKLKEVLNQHKENIIIKDSEVYKRCRVQVHRRGIVLRDVVKGLEIKTKSQQVCKRNQFLVAEIDAKVGGYGIVPDELDGAIVSSHYYLFDIDLSKLSLNYFRKCIVTEDFFSQIKAEGSTNYASIRSKDVLDIEIPLPSLLEQEEIANKVHLFFTTKEEFESIQTRNGKLISRLRQAILQEAVQGKIVPQDSNDEPASELLKKIQKEKEKLIKEGKIKKQKPLPPVSDDESPYELPRGWAWCRFGNIAQHNSGKTLDKGRNKGILTKYITTSNLYWGYFELDNLRQMPIEEKEIEKCSATKGDLLIIEGGEAGRASVWEEDYDVCFQNHIHRARFFGEISPYYLFRFFEKINLTGEINNYRKGVAISNMSGKSLSSIMIPLPPLPEQKRIVEKVDKLMAYCDELEKQVKENQTNSKQLMGAVLGESFGR